MKIEPWILQLVIVTILTIFGYFISQYLNKQDKRYEQIQKETKLQSERLLSAITKLEGVIAGLKTNSAVHKTMCVEKHRAIDDKFKHQDKKFEILFTGQQELRDSIFEIKKL